MAVRPSTQQTIDRIVGTVALLGLSLAALRWLSHPSKRRQKSLPWWWPVIALQRRRNKREGSLEGEVDQSDAREKNMERGFEHRGSCHCRSVQFMLRGPQYLRAIDSPGKIRYPHIPTSAVQFHLLRGENDMKFYYVDDKTDSSIAGSTIASEEPNYNFENDNDQHNSCTQQQSAGAHGFCGNCGVHILRAPSRSSEDLEINANCLEGGLASPKKVGDVTQLQRSSTSSFTSTGVDYEISKIPQDELKLRSNPIETVNENEQLLGGSANFWESLDERPTLPEPYEANISLTERRQRSDSIQNSQPLTRSITESDDFSMGSSSFTATSSLHMLSVASGHVGASASSKAGLPPLPPSSGMSAKTLPPRFDKTQGTGYSAGRSVGANWSIASIESNDLVDAEADKSNTLTPKTMNQMKYYMSRHMTKEKKDAKRGS